MALKLIDGVHYADTKQRVVVRVRAARLTTRVAMMFMVGMPVFGKSGFLGF